MEAFATAAVATSSTILQSETVAAAASTNTALIAAASAVGGVALMAMLIGYAVVRKKRLAKSELLERAERRADIQDARQNLREQLDLLKAQHEAGRPLPPAEGAASQDPWGRV